MMQAPEDPREGMLVCYLPEDETRLRRHSWYYNRCLICNRHVSEVWERNVMPKLSQVLSNTESTWGEHIQDKTMLEGTPFWIHNARTSNYHDTTNDRDVSLIVLDITISGPSRKSPRAVITVGHTEERQSILDYFQNERREGNTLPDPMGPCVTYSVPLKGGLSFWRIEDAPEEDDTDVESALTFLSGKTPKRGRR